jgi:rod shape-determining protein MreC
MESVFSRYKNLIVLVVILFAQVLGLAVQVKRTTDTESTRLIRLWAISAVTPFEKAFNGLQNGSWNLWHNYFYLRGVRQENRDLKAQVEQLRIEQVRLSEDAQQARRLQVLLGFKEQYIQKTLPAQVIGSSGSEQSRSVFIDKGEKDGLKPDMAVITSTGIVGKVLKVFRSTSQVLLIDDQSSGVGGILEKSRLQGIVRGTPAGEVVLERVMSDETVQAGESVMTSGGDRIFPKGLPVGTVTKVLPGSDLFLNIRLRPAANLNKLEEVLVVTQVVEKEPSPSESGPVRAVDILAQRLPSVPDKPAEDPNSPNKKPDGAESNPGVSGGVTTPKPKPESGGPAETTPPRMAETGGTPGSAVPSSVAPKKSTTNPDAATPATAKPVIKPGADANTVPRVSGPVAGSETKVANKPAAGAGNSATPAGPKIIVEKPATPTNKPKPNSAVTPAAPAQDAPQ